MLLDILSDRQKFLLLFFFTFSFYGEEDEAVGDRTTAGKVQRRMKMESEAYIYVYI